MHECCNAHISFWIDVVMFMSQLHDLSTLRFFLYRMCSCICTLYLAFTMSASVQKTDMKFYGHAHKEWMDIQIH